jgi:hypothetical protein
LSQQELHIGLNRRKLIINVGVSAVLAFAGLIGFFWIADHQEFVRPVFFKTVGGIWFGFFAILGGTHSARLTKKKSGLTLSKEGIDDQSSSIAVGLIGWKEIREIKSAKGVTSNLLIIQVRKPEQFINSANNKAIKRLMKQNLSLYKTPIVINAKILNCSFEVLEKEVSAFFERFSKHQI